MSLKNPPTTESKARWLQQEAEDWHGSATNSTRSANPENQSTMHDPANDNSNSTSNPPKPPKKVGRSKFF